MFYLIEDTLRKVSRKEIQKSTSQYVAVLTYDEWKKERDSFEMGIDIDSDILEIYTTKAEVNYDSLTGSFSIPHRNNLSADDCTFAFVLDEKGMVFIDNTGMVTQIIDNILRTKKWKLPSLERFIYDFLDQIVKDDLRLMEKYECELEAMENMIEQGDDEELPSDRLNDIRSDIRYLRIHYELYRFFLRI